MPPPPVVTVGHLLRGRADAYGLGLELLAGATGLDREISSPYIQKTGLALAGYHEYLRPGRVLIYGDSEIRYLQSLAADPALSGGEIDNFVIDRPEPGSKRAATHLRFRAATRALQPAAAAAAVAEPAAAPTADDENAEPAEG